MEYFKETDNDKANQLMEIMYQEYFEKGANINSNQVLEDLALRVGGITTEQIRDVLQDESRLMQVVQKDQMAKRQMGVTGVPYFIIEAADDSKEGKRRPVAFSGAQPAELIAEVLEEQAS
eukprot:scaffold8649_cov185-Amphora_coffeaeformis.AAC.6